MLNRKRMRDIGQELTNRLYNRGLMSTDQLTLNNVTGNLLDVYVVIKGKEDKGSLHSVFLIGEFTPNKDVVDHIEKTIVDRVD